MRLLRSRSARASFVLIAAAAVAACGGGGGGTSSTPVVQTSITAAPATPVPTPTPTASPAPLASTSASASVTAAGGSVAFTAPIGAGYTSNVTFGAGASASATISGTFETTASGAPAVASVKRLPKTIGATVTPLVFFVLSTNTTLTFPATPAFTVTLPAAVTFPAGTSFYLAEYDATSTSGWNVFVGPATVSGSIVTFAPTANAVTFSSGHPIISR